MRDYINDTFIKLTKEGRIADAVTFCEKVAEEAPYTEFKCLALKNLAECHSSLRVTARPAGRPISGG